MKKRFLSLILTLCLLGSFLAIPAGAAPARRFSDVNNQTTATAVEVLRLMGVMDGYEDGSFRPDAQLTRAQFCKMAVYAMHRQDQLGLYRTVTVFPDVKPSHWAAPYINLCSRSTVDGTTKAGNGNAPGQAIIAGFPDGKFHPERVVSLGQAVTILLRVLGYQDSEIGGVWPESYMASAAVAGLLKGLPENGNAPLTRGQAAQLFVNLLQAKKPGGGTLYSVSEELTELVKIDPASGKLQTLAGSYDMAHPVKETALMGQRGRLVYSGKIALTFLPDFGSGALSSAAAVVLYEDGSTVGFQELAGNHHYQIYKNGSPASAKNLKRYDVASYYADTNSIQVTDTRLTGYYESCEPNPQAPTKIKLMGTEFFVLPTAAESFRSLRPGQQITLLLTADGSVAAALPADSAVQGNALAYVDDKGAVELFCGSGTLKLAVTAGEEFFGQVVTLGSSGKDKVGFGKIGGGTRGTLDLAERTLGGVPLAEGVLLFSDGKKIGFGDLSGREIPADKIRYGRTNWAGQVDLIVIDAREAQIYGRIFEEYLKVGNKTVKKIGVEYGDGKRTPAIQSGNANHLTEGQYVRAEINRSGTMFLLLETMPALRNVSFQSWLGKTAVTVGGTTYEVPANVLCYNAGAKEWTTLDRAMAYAESADLYFHDGVIRIVEVR